MIELKTMDSMTLAELKTLAETTEEIRIKRLNDELTKREKAIQSLLDECFDLIEESGLEVYADTPSENFYEPFSLSEVLTFEYARDDF